MSQIFSNTLNILENWRQSNYEQNALNQQADDLLNLTALETKQARSQAKEDKGNTVGKAGASGITVSSFNDYLLSEQLKTEQDIYKNQLESLNQASALRSSADNKQESLISNSLSYSAGLLSDLFGF